MGTIMTFAPLFRRLLGTKFGLAIIVVGVIAYMSGYNPLTLLSSGGMTSSRPINTAKTTEKLPLSKVY